MADPEIILHGMMSEGHLILFDRTGGKTWEEKIFRRVERLGDRRVTAWGM